MSDLKQRIWARCYKGAGFVLRFLRSRPWLARRLFYVNVVSTRHQHVWDGTTWILRKALRRYVKDGDRVLDLGTGHIGILSIYCSKLRKVDIVAVDINEAFLENAKLVAAASTAGRIEFRRSDWFSNVDGRFDIIFSNVPYIPTEVGLRIQHLTEHREVWDGGDHGDTEVRRILKDARSFLSTGGHLLLGIASMYLPRSVLLPLIDDEPGLVLEEIVTSWISPCEVYVIRCSS